MPNHFEHCSFSGSNLFPSYIPLSLQQTIIASFQSNEKIKTPSSYGFKTLNKNLTFFVIISVSPSHQSNSKCVNIFSVSYILFSQKAFMTHGSK
jgi:hypothetical protein